MFEKNHQKLKSREENHSRSTEKAFMYQPLTFFVNEQVAFSLGVPVALT